MSLSDSYGESFGRRLNARARSFATRALPKSTIAVTELRYDHPEFVLSTPPIEEDAFLLAVHLELFERYEYWEDGKAAPISTLHPGDTIVYDVKRKPTFHLNSAFHSVHFYVPVSALHAIADEAEAPRIDELHYRPAVSHADAFLRHTAEALIPHFAAPSHLNQLFIDHYMLAVGHHVASTYGALAPRSRPKVAGLTSRQERWAKELMSEDLSGKLRLADLARECGLSTSQFSRAFRRTVGESPHQWLIRQRIERAKTLLRESEASLAEIALGCGYCDQSHFTRSFTAWTGISPGRWRRVQ
ncbi:transcriptional regulator [Mycolicibacterium madagascariense]|uniref:Transcriptional regulator n=1 Tax=Mycolicibacterium madagascariense TaxID=212765 RepID=A0A7I7XBJ2_9MYCO|nr:AraC family transcriptional regulator [Mycolicibacterium madagascariense]MCV7011870.1 helix-turn-helix transcriptional regulator [Mycolicibacterium madagascariense]BBZ26277.1 transcriptional regulator [Mycolicibacterium madagascariense]